MAEDSGQLYNGVALYGASTGAPIYGSEPLEIVAAKSSSTRQCGMVVAVVDENFNDWSDFSGSDINNETTYYTAPAPGIPTSSGINYWGYRGQASMSINLAGNKIIWARVGNGQYNDRGLYYKVITDPTNTAQWAAAWTLLDAGPCFAVAVGPGGTHDYYIYYSKNDGVYLSYAGAAGVKHSSWTKVVRISLVQNKPNAAFITTIFDDPADDNRVMNLLYSKNIYAGTGLTNPFLADITNFRWYRNAITAISLGTTPNRLYRYHQYAHGMSPRQRGQSDALMMEEIYGTGVDVPNTEPILVRGLGGGAGLNTIENPWVTKIGNFYYLFYAERHHDIDGSLLGNLNMPLVWQRSTDGRHWSEPIPVGHTLWGFAGVVPFGSYVYMAGNGRVLRRPLAATAYDISDYVTHVQLDIPRDNQPGSGTIQVANPENVVGKFLGMRHDTQDALVGRRIAVRPQLLGSQGTWKGYKLDEWWVSSIAREEQGAVHRLEIQLEDYLGRLDNPYRDTFNFIGKTTWHDWADNRTNQLFNYFAGGGGSMARRLLDGKYNTYELVVSSGHVIWTGWKGYNFRCKVSINNQKQADGSTPLGTVAKPIKLIYRYKDQYNYYSVNYEGTKVTVYKTKGSEQVPGVPVQLVSWNLTRPQDLNQYQVNIQVDCTWAVLDVFLNGKQLGSLWESNPEDWAGYVGFEGSKGKRYSIGYFNFQDHEFDLTREFLIRTAFAHGDYHDIIVGEAGDRQLGVTWGPQSDIQSPAEAVTKLLEAGKMRVTYDTNTDKVHVGKFKHKNPLYTINDTIISNDHVQASRGRVNIISVDGNSHSWLQIDGEDLRRRDRALTLYLDVPELLDQESVRKRALEELEQALTAMSPGATCVWMPPVEKYQVVNLVDHSGNKWTVRIEGLSYEFNMGTSPFQHVTLDTSPIEICV